MARPQGSLSPRLPGHLHSYQREAVEWALRVRKGILADDIGLGKTITSIAFADALLEPHTAVLIVCPKSLIAQWKSEVERFSAFPNHYHYLNYESLHKMNFLPSVLIVDEATYIKSPTAKRTVTTISVAMKTPNVLFLTATPVRNHEADMFTMLYCFHPVLRAAHTGDLKTDMHRSYHDFVEAFFDKRMFDAGNGRIIEQVGKMNRAGREMLTELIDGRVMRRTKTILKLPAFSRSYEVVEMSSGQRASYEQVMSGILAMDDGATKDVPNFLAQMTRLRQAALDPALFGGKPGSGKTEWIKEAISTLRRPTLIFTNYAEYAKLLHKALPGSTIFHGGMSSEMREVNKSAFMEGRSDTLILSAGAGGFGLNLQRANVVIWTDRPWTPDVWEQGTGRAYRQGQTEEVHEFVLGHPNTIDGKVDRLLRRKERVANEVSAMIQVWRELRAERR